MSERGITCETARKIPGLDESSKDEDNDENMEQVSVLYQNRKKYKKGKGQARHPRTNLFPVLMPIVQIRSPLVPKSPWGLWTKVMISIAKAINGPQADPMK